MCAPIYNMRCALGCERSGAPLHRFPNPNKFPEQFKAWVEVIGGIWRSSEDYDSYKNKRICGIHFKKEDQNRNHRLNCLAVPSLHLPMWCNYPSEASTSASTQITAPSEASTSASTQITADVTTEKDDIIPEQIAIASSAPQVQTCNEHHFPNPSGSAKQDDIIPEQVAIASSAPQVQIFNEHNYFPKPSGSVRQDEIIPENIPFTIASSAQQVFNEHNYCPKPSESVRQGQTPIEVNRIPGHLLEKLKISAKQIKNLKRQLMRLRKRGLSFKERLENALKISKDVAFQTIAQNMTKSAKIFTNMQLREGAKKPKGRRFTTEEKILALTIFKRSAKCYSFLTRMFSLPSKKTLKCLLSNVHIKDGINPIVFGKIKKTVASLNYDKKLCSIIFDEMSISPQIHFDAAKDQLKGFTSTEYKIANHVLVFMIKGIKANFKQPVAYYFTNSLTKIELKKIVIDVIKNVQATGLKVMCTVCDQSTVNVSTINSLVEDTKSEYMKRGREYRFTHFNINEHAIIPLYDVPHLLKGIRNNILTKDLIYYHEESKIERKVKWEYFQKIYEADKSYGELRVAHKLTEEHVNTEKIKKMRVKTAAQVFSHSVAVAAEHLSARGDLPAECRDLIPFVLLIDKLFDSLNGNTFNIPNGKIYKGSVKRNSPHHELWQKAKKMLQSVKFINKNCNNKGRLIETNVPSVINFIKTIDGVQNLWNVLHKKYSFDTLLTRNLNQDPVENFFGNIRSYGVRNVAPNCISFEGAYKSLLLNNYNTPHSIQANCEEDKNKCLQTLEFFLTEKPDPNVPEEIKINYIINEDILNTSQTVIKDQGQREYVCGWVIKKCLKNIIKSCKHCRTEVTTSNKKENSLIAAKEYNKKKTWMCYPKQNIEETFQEIQNITCKYLRKDVPKYGLKENIKILCQTLIKFPFTCEVHKVKLEAYFVDITIKVLIYSWCRSINRILSGKISYDFDGNELKLAAHNYYEKNKKYKVRK